MKICKFLTLFLLLICISSCSDEIVKPGKNWKVSKDLTIIKKIIDNNSKIKSFKAKFYLTENKKRMALNGTLYFDMSNNNFSFTLQDVLVSSKVLTMTKNGSKILLLFHRQNKKYIENINTINLSRYNFLIELDDLIKFISLKIPLLQNAKVFEQKKDNVIIYLLKTLTKEQIVFVDLTTKRVKRINYKRYGRKYSLIYSAYSSKSKFYYPETAKILNYSEKQRILIKIEKIKFVKKISKSHFSIH